MRLIVSGSLAFDRLAEYPGVFSDSILPEKLNIINVCFLVDKVERIHGGTAGNIAYNLILLGEKPLLISSIGDDDDGRAYLKRLRSWNLSLEAIHKVNDHPTAGAYIATDKLNNQLIFFHPGAMVSPTTYDVTKLSGSPSDYLAIVSPGCVGDMKTLSRVYRERNLSYIFDPGQQTPLFSGMELLDMLQGARALITNEYELELFLQKTKLGVNDLFSYTQTIVTTLGARGCELRTANTLAEIPAAPVAKVVNPTGAGDAFRAGLLKGLCLGMDTLSACRLGAVVSAYCVEAPGTQEHIFSLEELNRRFFTLFNETLHF
ncbi:MAG: carbohydrate kinase family protein [Deltaproteobacteria bacterium]|jgi:adenosine kinase|nr:carbohydrate kinase family protein [Deltaproteobacteria bacterium]